MTSAALDIALVDARTHPFAMQPACSQSLRLVRILPRGGTHRGGILVHIASDPKRQGFAAASDPKCAFGNRHVRATVINATLLSCIAPAINLSDPLLSLAHGSRGSSLLRRTMALEVTMDGVSFSASQMQFTYYDADSVSIVATINPSGGPRFGGTMVRFGAASNVADYQGAVWEAVGVGTVNTTDVLTPISGLGCRFGARTAFVRAMMTNQEVRAMMTNQEGWARPTRIVRDHR
jgi:hypothetical protein